MGPGSELLDEVTYLENWCFLVIVVLLGVGWITFSEIIHMTRQIPFLLLVLKNLMKLLS